MEIVEAWSCDTDVELRGGTVELAGVKHRLDGPCFLCDEYGEARS